MKNAPRKSATLLGIDIGSVALSIVQMDFNGKIINSYYGFHHGELLDKLTAISDIFDLSTVVRIGCIGNSQCLNAGRVRVYNAQVALIEAKKKYSPEAASLLHVGAEKFMLIQFDEEGKYDFTKLNSSCAAGTGSFLDQQSHRLNLPNINAFCQNALQNTDDIPEIASRCAVFAKTDLIHAQQRGFSINAICDSLCKGLVKNILDTVYANQTPQFPLLITGGVSQNGAVKKYLEQQLGGSLLEHSLAHLFGAVGAGLLELKNDLPVADLNLTSLREIILEKAGKKEYFYEPLSLKLSDYPDFSSFKSFQFKPSISGHSEIVEVDEYLPLRKLMDYSCFIGIDIGSTSTKAIVLSRIRKPLVGLYTYTAGAPMTAVKSLFEAMEQIEKTNDFKFRILGVSTTGSGRNFVGKIIGADQILDEITTHARAAYELKPETDTIIEIGGQDAKFTQMQNGRVTFSQMNTVCAAGTGSFIEEQAKKLNCPLENYAYRASLTKAPLASDRCTVFMERDINQLKSQGFSSNEILATVLHSVTQNYLQKVAGEASIGNCICFQGATARNKALIAAFEQRLQKPVFVSKYCHLTGALGAALMLIEEKKRSTSFRGLGIYREEISIKTEQCDLCNNHCRISLANVGNENVAYGFLCGRDYETKKHVPQNKAGFDLIKERRKILSVRTPKEYLSEIIIGLPASLHLFEEIPLWKKFFQSLSIRTVTSETYRDALKEGKFVAGAEFCAPVTAHFGHVAHLTKKADYVFLPLYLKRQDSDGGSEGLYCYYTQYSSALVYTTNTNGLREKHLSPHLDFSWGTLAGAIELTKCLKPVFKEKISLLRVYNALKDAVKFNDDCRIKLSESFKMARSGSSDIAVMLLGRPYVVLSKTLNKGIPEIFNKMGIMTFFQDMMEVDPQLKQETQELLKKVPWNFASKILETAYAVARSSDLYPVLITAFKCSPDAFVIEYFKKIMQRHNKPYLILQIDEHDSNVGYQTRIEAAIRSFQNHAAKIELQKMEPRDGLLPEIVHKIGDKVLLFPSWDSLVTPLLVANLKRLGLDVREMKSSEQIIRKSMAHNTGQCLPVNIIAQEFMEYVKENNLAPENTLLWLFESKLSCNIRLYPEYVKNIFEKYGNGFEKAGVYGGLVSHLELSPVACYYAYFAYMLGGLLRSVACKIRPYELVEGTTDKVVENSVLLLRDAFLGKVSLEKAVKEVVELFEEIPVLKTARPKVAIFGDIYVCDNEIMNQDLHRAIEQAGGEVISTTYADYHKLIELNRIRLLRSCGDHVKATQLQVISAIIKILEQKYYRYFEPFLGPAPVVKPRELEKKLVPFNINPLLSGESYDNILKVFFILENHPEVELFVQANPSFCCPSLVSEAMTNEIKRITGVQVVTLTYDGTNEYKNDVIIPYLQAAIDS